MSDIKIKLAAGTNVGLIRTNNEDNFVASRDLTASDWTIPQMDEEIDLGKYGALLVVADGMGGANAGEVASAIAIETIQFEFTSENLEEAVRSDGNITNFMVETVKKADLNIYNRSMTDEKTQGMGTTIVLCWILGQKAYICWCGDSRCYVYNGGVLTRLSKDHSYVQELVDKGELSPENAHNHPYSNVITRCLGDMQHRAVPDTRIYGMQDGDIFLLCSDGLCGLCLDDEIAHVVNEHQDDINSCKNELISAALAAGGYDNVTVVMGAVQMENKQVADDSKTEEPEGKEEPESNDVGMGKTKSVEVHHSTTKNVVIAIVLLAVLAGAIYWFKPELFKGIMGDKEQSTIVVEPQNVGKELPDSTNEQADSTALLQQDSVSHQVTDSVAGR